VPDTVTATRESQPESSGRKAWEQRQGITRVDNVLRDDQRGAVYDFLREPGWKFGWKSRRKVDEFSFFHKHFAGYVRAENSAPDQKADHYDCADELQCNAPLIYGLWLGLQKTAMKGRTLMRCYANGLGFGSDGTLHTDSRVPNSFTSIYYPHDRWSPNWGGETVFFTHEDGDIIASVYPKPNRLVLFNGTIWHVARGVSRMCPVLRITLMFKTEVRDG
jgi:SM-20-related protein